MTALVTCSYRGGVQFTAIVVLALPDPNDEHGACGNGAFFTWPPIHSGSIRVNAMTASTPPPRTSLHGLLTDASPPPACRADEAEIRAWLTSPPPGDCIDDRLRLDSTCKADWPNLDVRLSRLVSDAQSGSVFGVARRPIRLWQVADEVAVNTLLVTVKLPDRPWLAFDESTDLHLLGVNSYGKDAAVHALRAIARSVDAELRLHAEICPPTHTRCSGKGDARIPQDPDASGRPTRGTRAGVDRAKALAAALSTADLRGGTDVP
jgi:hypothetical protein